MVSSGLLACALWLAVLPVGVPPAAAQGLPGDLLVRAGRALDAEDWQQALELYQGLIEQHPLHEAVPLAHFASGECLLNLGRYEEALKSYRIVIDEYPDWSDIDDAQFRVGNCLFQLGHYAEAAQTLTAMLEAFPASTIADKAAYWLGEANYQAGNEAAALDSYRRSLGAAPRGDYAPYALYSIATVESPSDPERAVVTYKRLLDEFPNSPLTPDALYRMGQVLETLGRLDEAHTAYSRVVEQFAATDAAAYAAAGIASVQFSRGEYALAAQGYLNVAQKHADEAGACVWMLRAGDALLAAEDYEGAARVYARVTAGADRQCAATAAYLQGVAYQGAGLDQQAIGAFEHVRTEYPDHPSIAEVNLRLGAFYYTAERFDDALAAYKAASDLATDAAIALEARYGAAWTAFRRAGQEQHLHELQAVLAGAPDSQLAARGLLPSAELALTAGSYAIALDLAQLLITHHPEHPSLFGAWLVAGQSQRGLGKLAEARAAFESALAVDRTSPTADLARVGLALVAVDLADAAGAEALLGQIDPNGPAASRIAQLQCLLGDAHYAAQQYAQAAERYLSAAERGDGDWETTAMLGAADALLASGQTEAAVTCYKRFLDRAPDSPAAPQARVQLGIALARAGNHAQAARELETAVAAAGDALWLPEALMELASAQAHAGNLRAAATTYLRVADEYADSPAAPEALFWAAEARYEQGSFAKAAELYQRLLVGYPESDLRDGASYKLAWSLLKTDRHDEALPYLLAAAESVGNPAMVSDARLQAGYILMHRRDYARAVDVLQPATRMEPAGAEAQQPAVLLLLGQAYLAEGRHLEATEVLERVSAEYPQSPYLDRSRVALGRCYQLSGKLTQAEDALRPLLASADRQLAADAHFEMAELRRTQKRFPEAAALYITAATTTQNSELAANALFLAGACYEQAAQPQDAIRAYTRLIGDYAGEAEWVGRARERLTALGAGG